MENTINIQIVGDSTSLTKGKKNHVFHKRSSNKKHFSIKRRPGQEV
ncbi:MAG: hypothetical protein IJF17_11875 [Thermoguttaceae bacterium]|nr:hypothetical protein [Thermoguttaceae bacterium]